jgi:hypothetical protein
MTDLSSAAQAVYDAFWEGIYYNDDITDSNVAAALRAAAEQIETLYCDSNVEDSPGIVFACCQLVLLAEELEARPE